MDSSSRNASFVRKPALARQWASILARLAVGTFLFAVFLGMGIYLGPYLRIAYDGLAAQPAYVTGDYETLYRKTGRQVVMFSTSTCPYCRRTREFFNSQRIDYEDFVIDQSADSEAQFKALGGGGVPLIFIGDRRIVGFREGILRESLASIQR